MKKNVAIALARGHSLSSPTMGELGIALRWLFTIAALVLVIVL